MTARLLLLLALLAASPASAATSPVEMLADPALEARARALGQELRCLVCQNQSIDDSDADLAKDLRRLVREKLAAGQDETAIRAFLVDRYGPFVLLRPPVEPATWLLWLGPLLVGLGGAFLVWRQFRRRVPATEPETAQPLDAVERARLERLLGEAEPR